MSRKISIIGSIFIFIVAILSLIDFHAIFSPNQPTAKDGVIDLSAWDFDEDGTIQLNGSWTLYPGKLIIPNASYEKLKVENIDVPGNWNKYVSSNRPYGTYHLLIDVPVDGTYGLIVGTIRHSNRIYINGVEAGASGNPTEDRNAYRFGDTKYMVHAESINKRIEVVIQVANYKYPTGGIVHSIIFGKNDQIIAKKDLNRLLDAIPISGYLLLFIINFVAYFQQRKSYELYFSIFCLLLGLYGSIINEKLLLSLLPHLSPIFQVNLQLFFIHTAVLFLLLFIYSFFKPYAKKRVVTIICIMLSIQVFLFALPNTLSFNNIPIKYIQIEIILVLFISYIYILSILVKALLNKIEGSEYVLVIVASFLCYGVLLSLNFLVDTDIGIIPFFLFLTTVVSLSSLIGFRSQVAYKRGEELSKELLYFDELKDEFLAKTSHELRTPLHGIVNLSQSLMEGAEGPLMRKQQESVLLIHKVGRRLARLVEDLLYARNSKRGEVQLFPAPVNVHIVENIMKEMSYLLPNRHTVKLINNIPQDLPLVFVDESRFNQIYFNLIHNAIKFTLFGEIIISAEVVNKEMQISIKDTGIGMDKGKLERIFSAFYQIENSEFLKTEGLGLGLSITKQLVELSGGRIWVSSEVDKGSCFTFTLPLANEQQLANIENVPLTRQRPLIQMDKTDHEAIQLVLPQKREGKGGFTILVVDDEHANLKVILNVVSSLDYTVIAVETGEEALEIVKQETVDLMIIDLMMPGISGFEVCKKIRQDYDLVELPILILTAAGQMSDLITSFQLGANDFLQKPINMEEIKMRIESLLLVKKSSQEAINYELSYFNAQITPHFLYNTLNTIIGLSYKDEEKTREALQYLAIYFRAKLDYKNHHSLIQLEDELELVYAYIAIEKMRFGERLTVEYDIDETIEGLIPSMTIQPLIENAVQHGIAKKKDGGTVRLSIKKPKNDIEIIIEDDGVGIPLEKQVELLNERYTRIGFTNPFRKLKLIKNATFELESTEGKGTKILIRLPEVKSG